MMMLAVLGATIAIGAFVAVSDDDETTIDELENEGNGTDPGETGDASVLFYGDNADDDETGGSGSDTLYGGSGDDVLTGNGGNDGLDGEHGQDSLDGGNGNDVLQGGYQNDILTGGGGNDFLMGEFDDDVLDGGGGNDGLHGGNGADTLHGGDGDDLLNGGVLDLEDQLLEEWLDDFQAGQAVNTVGDETTAIIDEYVGDSLDGGDGNDTLIGGPFDVLTGGDGVDTFVTGDWSNSPHTATVTDFDTNGELIVYRYDETGPAPAITMDAEENSDGTSNITLFADGTPVLSLLNVAPDFDLATHVRLVEAPMA